MIKNLLQWWKEYNCMHKWLHIKILKKYKWGILAYDDVTYYNTLKCINCGKEKILKF